MWASPGVATSTPASLLASAPGYQVLTRGALGKSLKISSAPAEPSTAPVSSQGRGSKVAATRIGTGLVRVAPQIFAACWKAYRRCSPRVVPGLPPTGGAGVGSLKPTPGT